VKNASTIRPQKFMPPRQNENFAFKSFALRRKRGDGTASRTTTLLNAGQFIFGRHVSKSS
jgi:hypothetical protein